MAPSAPATPVDPLQDFDKLGDGMYIYTPVTSSRATRSLTGAPDVADPGLLIFCAWMFANPRHFAKYLKVHRDSYPGTTILLLANNLPNMIWRPDRFQMPLLRPAVDVVQKYLEGCEGEPRVLVHVFSNGGAHMVVQLAQAFQETTQRHLPVSAMVIDSAPGVPPYFKTVHAMTMGLPKSIIARTIGVVLVYAVILGCAICHWTGIAQLAAVKAWQRLNDAKGPFLRSDCPRTYICSAQDTMIPIEDVLRHASEARAAVKLDPEEASELIRCEEFQGTAHVNHVAKEPSRYWTVVQDAWKRA